MGVWSSPFHDELVATEFAHILKSDTTVSPHAGQEFYDSVGDDGFFNLVSDAINDDPHMDLRLYAAAWVQKWLERGDQNWRKSWNPAAVEIVREAVEAFSAAHPGEVRLPAEYLRDYFGEAPAPAFPR